MSYEFGFDKEKFNEETRYTSENNYLNWCGWDMVQIHDLFANFGKPHLIAEDEYKKYYDYEIEVEKLAFIEQLYRQLTANKHYNIILKLCKFDDNFVEDYVDSLSIQEKAELRLAFLLDINDYNIERLCLEFYRKFENGWDMVGALYQAYRNMIKDGVKTVWLYGG